MDISTPLIKLRLSKGDSRAIKPPSGLLSKGPDSPSNDKAGGYSPAKPVISMRISGKGRHGISLRDLLRAGT